MAAGHHTPAVTSLPPAGWYPDPEPGQEGRERYWNGARWATGTRPAAMPVAPRPPLGDGWRTLAGLLQGLLGLGLLVELGRVALALWTADVAAGWREDVTSYDLTTATRIDQLSLTAGIVELVLLLATGIVFITWLYRAHRSSRMHPAVLRHGSGWAIGGWFVPILGLWRPVQMVNDVRRGAMGFDPPTGGALVGWWWASFIVMNLSGTVTSSIGPMGDERPRRFMELLVYSARADLVDAVVVSVASALAILLVRHVTGLVQPAAAGEATAAAPAADAQAESAG